MDCMVLFEALCKCTLRWLIGPSISNYKVNRGQMTEWVSLPPWIGLSVGTKFRDVSVLLTLRDPVPAQSTVQVMEDDIHKQRWTINLLPQNIGVKLLNKNTMETIIPAKQLTLYSAILSAHSQDMIRKCSLHDLRRLATQNLYLPVVTQNKRLNLLTLL